VFMVLRLAKILRTKKFLRADDLSPQGNSFLCCSQCAIEIFGGIGRASGLDQPNTDYFVGGRTVHRNLTGLESVASCLPQLMTGLLAREWRPQTDRECTCQAFHSLARNPSDKCSVPNHIATRRPWNIACQFFGPGLFAEYH